MNENTLIAVYMSVTTHEAACLSTEDAVVFDWNLSFSDYSALEEPWSSGLPPQVSLRRITVGDLADAEAIKRWARHCLFLGFQPVVVLATTETLPDDANTWAFGDEEGVLHTLQLKYADTTDESHLDSDASASGLARLCTALQQPDANYIEFWLHALSEWATDDLWYPFNLDPQASAAYADALTVWMRAVQEKQSNQANILSEVLAVLAELKRVCASIRREMFSERPSRANTRHPDFMYFFNLRSNPYVGLGRRSDGTWESNGLLAHIDEMDSAGTIRALLEMELGIHRFDDNARRKGNVITFRAKENKKDSWDVIAENEEQQQKAAAATSELSIHLPIKKYGLRVIMRCDSNGKFVITPHWEDYPKHGVYFMIFSGADVVPVRVNGIESYVMELKASGSIKGTFVVLPKEKIKLVSCEKGGG